MIKGAGMRIRDQMGRAEDSLLYTLCHSLFLVIKPRACPAPKYYTYHSMRSV